MAIIFVRTTGDDGTGDGTFQKPFKTIDKGVTTSVAGDTIDVGDGAFAETNQVDVDKNLTIRGKGAGKTTWSKVGLNLFIQSSQTNPTSMVVEEMFLSHGGDANSQEVVSVRNSSVTGGSSATLRRCTIKTAESGSLVKIENASALKPGFTLVMENCILDGLGNNGGNNGFLVDGKNSNVSVINCVLTNLQDGLRESVAGNLDLETFVSEHTCRICLTTLDK